MKKQNLAVMTGGTGLIGYHVLEALIDDGWRVIVLHRKSSNVSVFRGILDSTDLVELKEVDLGDERSIDHVFPEGVDVVFHLAANVSHHSDKNQWRDNVLATRNLAEVALEKEARRFIFTSTGAARFSRGESDPDRLRTQLLSGYAFTKRLAELEVENAAKNGLDVVILQPTVVLGEYDFHGNYSQLFEPNVLTRLRAALPGCLEFCDAKKIASAHLQAFYRGRRNEYYILGGKYLRWFELSQVIAGITGMPPPLFELRTWMLRGIAFVHMLGFRLFRIHPQVTRDLIWLLSHEDQLTEAEVANTKRDLGYDREDVDIHEWCRRVYRWMLDNP